MRTTGAGPNGVLREGAVVEVSEAQARELVAGGYADPVDTPPKADAPETATALEAPERARKRPSTRRRAKR